MTRHLLEYVVALHGSLILEFVVHGFLGLQASADLRVISKHLEVGEPDVAGSQSLGHLVIVEAAALIESCRLGRRVLRLHKARHEQRLQVARNIFPALDASRVHVAREVQQNGLLVSRAYFTIIAAYIRT